MKISAEKARIYAVSEIMLRVRFPPSPFLNLTFLREVFVVYGENERKRMIR